MQSGEPRLLQPRVEQEVNDAGIRETTLRFPEPVYGAVQRTWNDPRTEAAAEPLLEDGYVDAFQEGFDTVTFYTPAETPLDGFVDRFVDIVASHYEPPRRRLLDRSGRTAIYRGYRQDGWMVIDVRFDEEIPVVPKTVIGDEAFQEDVAALTDTRPVVATADDYDALREEVFHIYTDVERANVDAFMDAYLERMDEWMYAFDL